MSEKSQTTGDGISRRTVTKAMAWAVPAIAVAAPIPAFAASGPPPTVTVGPALKWPGASCTNEPGAPLDANKAYMFTFHVDNTTSSVIYIYGVTLTTSSGITFSVYGADPAFGTPIAPGDSVCLHVWANSSDSGNINFDAHAEISWGHNWPGPDPDNHAPVTKDWHVSSTPTPTSAGYGQCGYPPC
ncbi:hypothetical protein QF046_001405 [Microbacterium sp. W4I4]|uniref:hypothetical protein n=1 Tax=Microbacterium sp. W4I4 TaxID=3042295 RepID=UPI0027875263|nr:hypothetical protein [Microbacterium sp. W4I4]MDQ0613764.1 hypothetical protein [Microbacterium sp. W4I4]